MFAKRNLLVLMAALTATATARAQSYNLAEDFVKDSQFRVELDLTLKGQITIRQSGKVSVLEQSAKAHHEFVESLLEAGTVGLVDKAARIYDKAEANIIVAKEESPRKLRPDRALMIVQRQNDLVTAYCPKGPLALEECELTEHFDTLAIAGLLPGKEVAIGETWKLSNATAQALCYLDGLTGHDLTGKLEKVDGDRAFLKVTGTAQGIGLGAAVKVAIQAAAQFDLKERRVVAVEWKQTDEREQGPVSPALKIEVVNTVKRTPIEPVKDLHPFKLLPYLAQTPVTQIAYADGKGRFEMQFSRDWHMVGRTDDYLVLRLLERGDFLAQVTVAPWHKADPGKPLTPAQFKAVLDRAPGWEQDKLIEEKELNAERKGYMIYRIAATGQHEGVEVWQYAYLVAGPRGDQTIVTFTMTPAQAPKLEGRDMPLIRSLVYPGAEKSEQ
jgi:hypothetical protein